MLKCSCSASCKQRGNCCSDYETHNCDSIFIKASKVPKEICLKNSNCEMCDDLAKIEEVPKCNQCAQGFYLYEGKCVQSCPEGSIGESTNFTCLVRKESILILNVKAVWLKAAQIVLKVIPQYAKLAKEVIFFTIICVTCFVQMDLELIESRGLVSNLQFSLGIGYIHQGPHVKLTVVQ